MISLIVEYIYIYVYIEYFRALFDVLVYDVFVPSKTWSLLDDDHFPQIHK